MSSAQQVANSFVTEFFERLSKNPSGLDELYGHHSALHIHDFELGVKEIYDADVPTAVQSWATIVQGSKLRVESVNAAPVYGGVNVFVTFTAVGELQQYFHLLTSLEAYSGFTVEGYYIRHQIISRIGAIPMEAQPVEEELAPAEADVQDEAVDLRNDEPVEGEHDDSLAAQEHPSPVEESPAAPKEESTAHTSQVKTEEAPAVMAPKPKSWATLASSAPKGGLENSKPIRVIAHEGAAAATAAAATAAAAVAAKKEPEAAASKPLTKVSPKENVKREKRPAEAIGDRLMFNIDFAVTDDEIKTALSSVASSLVSLRNNSARGHVFMDFAGDVKALDLIKKLNPVIGVNKTRINIYRQRTRE